jgi:signal transduction histidine kinase
MRRLYLRIYLAVFASLVVFALLAGLVWRFGFEAYGPRHDPLSGLAGALVAELLPADGPDGQPGTLPPERLRERLHRWHERAHVDLSLYAEDGTLIDAAGRPIPPPAPGQSGWLAPYGGPPVFVATLPDGRRLAMRRPPPHPGRWLGFALPGFLASLALIALAVGVGAYPVVRKLTGRIERLQRSVDALGAGDLGARVRVEGRDEVAALASSFNRSAERIEALVRAQRDLLANASHELRSPLARIRMAMALLPGEPAGPLREELDRDIAELDQLIDEILLASRLEASGAAAGATAGAVAGSAPEPVDLAALCAEECARVGAEFALETLAGSDAGAVAVLPGEARLLRRLIRNLLENGVRYGDGKPVEAHLAHDPVRGALVLSVCDRGPGVPPEDRERIFEPFFRARGASERHGGVGLGLSLARQIAIAHRATIACQPRAGGGSCFVVAFPLDAARRAV